MVEPGANNRPAKQVTVYP